MRRNLTLFLLTVVTLTASGCNGGSGDGPLNTSTTGSTAPGSTSPAVTTTEAVSEVSGEVGSEGLLLEFPDGGSLDVPAGAIPEGAVVSAETLEAEAVTAPEGTSLIGVPIRITTSAQPTEPVVVVLPIPADAPRDDLWLLHVSDDGTSEIVGGAAERDGFVAAVRSFTDVALLHGKVSGILGIAGVPPVDLSFGGGEPEGPPADAPLIAEQGLMILGEMPEPGPRVVRILGPGEVGFTDAAFHPDYPYYAVGFEARKPRFVEYTWNLFGEYGFWEPDRDLARVSFLRPGRYTLTVDAYDPATGATAFAAKRILVAEGMFLSLSASRPEDYSFGDAPQVYFRFYGGEGPFVLDWAVGAATYQQTFDDDDIPMDGWAWSADPITQDTVVDAILTDATGATASAQLLLPFDPGGPDALLMGPASVAVGEEAVFTVETDQFPIRDLRFQVWPIGAIETDRRTARVVWDEPGVGRVGVFLASEEYESGVLPVAIDVVPIRIVGDPLPVVVRVQRAPESLAPGQVGEWRVRARGGIVASAAGFRGYAVSIDFDDGSDPVEVRIPAETAAVFTEPFPVSHPYDAPGEYDVTITATSPDGASATEVFPVTVAEQIVLSGEFVFPEPRNTPVWRESANEIELVIRGTEVEVTRFALDTDQTYIGFELGGGNITPDCSFNEVITLTGSDLTFDTDAQTITGTIQGHYFRTDDTGSNCPFGGRAGEERDLDSEVFDVVIVDGTIELGWLFGWFNASVVEDPGS